MCHMDNMLSPASPPSHEDWAGLDRRLSRADEDRWLSSRYAPRRERRALTALYLLNYELARVRTAVSEPGLGAIRFQWWRDAIEQIEAGGIQRRHDVVEALGWALQVGTLKPKALHRLIDGHEAAFEAGDRSLEPESLLMAIAAGILTERHGWGPHIQALAPAYAAARRGESKEYGPVIPKVPSVIRPALAHARLRRAYISGRLPGRMARRISVLRAMLSGRV